MPDDFLVSTLTPQERSAILQSRFQDALDREYPNAPAGTVAIKELESAPGWYGWTKV